MESVTAERAMLLSEEEQLEGTTTISLETQAALTEQDILVYIQNNFTEFLRILRYLKKEDQELLVSYYILSKTQTQLGIVTRETQTICSFRIRMAMKTLACFMMLGIPTREAMRGILDRARRKAPRDGALNSCAEGLDMESSQ